MAETPHSAPGETGALTERDSGGLPQFDTTQWPGQIAWLLIIFLVLFLLMRHVFVPRIGGALDTRADKIAGDIDDARRFHDEAEDQSRESAAETAKTRASAQKMAQDARARAQSELMARLGEEEAKLAKAAAEADARIAAARDKAMGNVEKIAADTAQAIVEKLTGKKATAAEVKSAMPRSA